MVQEFAMRVSCALNSNDVSRTRVTKGRETRVRSICRARTHRAYDSRITRDDITTRYCGKQTQVKTDLARKSTGEGDRDHTISA